MNTPPLRLFLLMLAGGFSLLRAGGFSAYVPGDSILYFEMRDLPAYRAEFSQTTAAKALESFDWKNLILQFYDIGIATDMDAGLEEPEATDREALQDFLLKLENRWLDFSGHLNGDVAFSVGNFKDVASVFRFNEQIRETLALTYDVDPDKAELTEEEMEQLEARIAEEERLDMQELNSLMGQVTLWMDVKEGDALETKLQAAFTEWLPFLNEDAEASEQLVLLQEKFEAGTLFALTLEEEDSPGIHWAIRDGVWVITFSRDELKKHLRQLEVPPETALARREAFQQSVEFIGPSDFLFYWDFAPLDALIRDVLAELPDEESEPIPFLGKLPTGEQVLDWMELDALLPYVVGSRLEADGFHSRGRFGFSRETALSRIFLDPENGTADIPAFIHKDFNQLSSYNWQLGGGWERLERELMGILPQAAAGMGLGRVMATGQIGFDIKLQFMDHLDGRTLLVQLMDPEVTRKIMESADKEDPAEILKVQMEHPTGGQNYLFAFGMKNEDAIREAFDRLMKRFYPQGAPAPEGFEGENLYYPVSAELQEGRFRNLVSYTFLDGYFVLALGDDQLLKDAVSAKNNPQLQLAKDPDFRAVMSRLPANPASIEYTNSAQTQNAMQMVESSLKMLTSDYPDLELPDLSGFAKMLHQSATVTVRKGLLIEIEALAEFPPEK